MADRTPLNKNVKYPVDGVGNSKTEAGSGELSKMLGDRFIEIMNELLDDKIGGLEAKLEDVKNEIQKVNEEFKTTIKLMNIRINAISDAQSKIVSTFYQPGIISEYEGYSRVGSGFNSRKEEWKKNPFL